MEPYIVYYDIDKIKITNNVDFKSPSGSTNVTAH